jgi:UDP-galactopyranose mutase
MASNAARDRVDLDMPQHEEDGMWTDTLIIGAGPAGLSAAYHYRGDYILVEKEERVGGLCRSVCDRGFVFDYAGHIIFTSDPYISDVLYPMLLGDNLHWQFREAWIYSKDIYTRYPFQASTYGLPVDVVKECILGAMEAAQNYRPDFKPESFAQFVKAQWGTGICKHFMVPYNRKVWTVPLEEMSWEWMNGRVPQPNLGEILDGALQPQPKPMGPNARFGYPLRGGYEALMRAWLRFLDRDHIWLNSTVVAIDPKERVAELNGGRQIHYEHLISTAPLPELLRMLGKLPAEIERAAQELRPVSLRCVNLGIERPDVSDKHWIYYPEDKTVFHRLFVQSNASPYLTPAGSSSLTAEITCSPTKPLPADGDDLIQRVVDDCQKVGVLNKADKVQAAHVLPMPYAYVLPTLHKEAAIAQIHEWLETQGLISAGRFGEWRYLNTDQAILSGKKAAERIEPIATLRPLITYAPLSRATRQADLLAQTGPSSPPRTAARK